MTTTVRRLREFIVPPKHALLLQRLSKRKKVWYTFDGKTRPSRDMGFQVPAVPAMVCISNRVKPTKGAWRPIKVWVASSSGPARITTLGI